MESRTENEILFSSFFEGKTVARAYISSDGVGSRFSFLFTDGSEVHIQSPQAMIVTEDRYWTSQEILDREG